MTDLLQAQLAPFGGVDGRRIRLSGPEVTLKPDVLQALGLAIHELATNATKHGALSVAKGSVSVTWSVEGDGMEACFTIRWIERGGPPVVQPTHKGFGHVIIGNSLASTMRGEVKMEFARKGLEWSVTAPLASLTPVA